MSYSKLDPAKPLPATLKKLISGTVQMLRKIWRSLLLMCLCFSLVLGCTRSTIEPVATGDGRITIGSTASINTIDPADAYTNFAGNLLYNLGDRLYGYKPGTDELQPQLATALPKVSPDRLTYTIPIRKGVVFHDGEPFNAKAMEFSLKRFIENGGFSCSKSVLA